MRPLNARQASNCEAAREPVCRCRCGGVLHGAKRGAGRAFFEALPADDPHRLPSDDERRELARLRRSVASDRRWHARYPGAFGTHDRAKLQADEARLGELERVVAGGTGGAPRPP